MENTITELDKSIGKLLIGFYDQMQRLEKSFPIDEIEGKKAVCLIMCINDFNGLVNSEVQKAIVQTINNEKR
jgi:hypothetical protein